MAKCYDTSNADGSTVGQIQDVIADKMKLADSVIGRQFKRFDGVDFIIGQTQTSDIAHIGEDARSDHTQIAFLDAQQLNNKKKKKKHPKIWSFDSFLFWKNWQTHLDVSKASKDETVERLKI